MTNYSLLIGRIVLNYLADLNAVQYIFYIRKVCFTVENERKEAVKANSLLPMLAQLKDSSYDVQFQSLRAIGNLCYEYGVCCVYFVYVLCVC